MAGRINDNQQCLISIRRRPLMKAAAPSTIQEKRTAAETKYQDSPTEDRATRMPLLLVSMNKTAATTAVTFRPLTINTAAAAIAIAMTAATREYLALSGATRKSRRPLKMAAVTVEGAAPEDSAFQAIAVLLDVLHKTGRRQTKTHKPRERQGVKNERRKTAIRSADNRFSALNIIKTSNLVDLFIFAVSLSIIYCYLRIVASSDWFTKP